MAGEEERAAQLRQKTYLRPAELAFLLGRDKSTINRWIREGMNYRRFGTDQRYVTLEDAVDWLKSLDTDTR